MGTRYSNLEYCSRTKSRPTVAVAAGVAAGAAPRPWALNRHGARMSRLTKLRMADGWGHDTTQRARQSRNFFTYTSRDTRSARALFCKRSASSRLMRPRRATRNKPFFSGGVNTVAAKSGWRWLTCPAFLAASSRVRLVKAITRHMPWRAGTGAAAGLDAGFARGLVFAASGAMIGAGAFDAGDSATGAGTGAGAGCAGVSAEGRRCRPRISRTTAAAPTRIHLGTGLAGAASPGSGAVGAVPAAGTISAGIGAGVRPWVGSAPRAWARMSALRASVEGEIW